jgi:hypothetical protein
MPEKDFGISGSMLEGRRKEEIMWGYNGNKGNEREMSGGKRLLNEDSRL